MRNELIMRMEHSFSLPKEALLALVFDHRIPSSLPNLSRQRLAIRLRSVPQR
jgi:hypothetical protein